MGNRVEHLPTPLEFALSASLLEVALQMDDIAVAHLAVAMLAGVCERQSDDEQRYELGVHSVTVKRER